MISNSTTAYWVTLTELKEILAVVSNKIEETPLSDTETREILHNIQSEVSVSTTRNETSIFPPNHIAAIFDLPSSAIPLRFSSEEIALMKTLHFSASLAQRLS